MTVYIEAVSLVETFIYHQGQTPARLKAIEHHAFGYTLTFRPL